MYKTSATFVEGAQAARDRPDRFSWSCKLLEVFESGMLSAQAEVVGS
jgi:hypothetical protein